MPDRLPRPDFASPHPRVSLPTHVLWAALTAAAVTACAGPGAAPADIDAAPAATATATPAGGEGAGPHQSSSATPGPEASPVPADVTDRITSQVPDLAALDLPVTDFTETRFAVARDAHTIQAIAFVPTTPGPHPTVILAHGFGGSMHDLARYARELAARGHAAVVFDFVGGSPRSESDPDMQKMSVNTELADLAAVVAHVQDQDYADPQRLTIFGHSQGGLVAAMFAAAHPDELANLVLLAPAFGLPELVRTEIGTASAAPETAVLLGLVVSRRYIDDIWAVRAADLGFAGPTLIVHGDADTLLPLADSQAALPRYPAGRLAILPGGPHNPSGESFTQAVSHTLAFLAAP
ncbi:alpha/beta hydrolase family protein [Buchananella hordeovulneris]|uniref:alpha/beta hydrolase family protein n=1 Tax=Buchananella hordeovulneris TaxID=52770 RepID=UPI001639712B|nr:alpha/beta fold hydrolase [Buchananella hordeovulneris]